MSTPRRSRTNTPRPTVHAILQEGFVRHVAFNCDPGSEHSGPYPVAVPTLYGFDALQEMVYLQGSPSARLYRTALARQTDGVPVSLNRGVLPSPLPNVKTMGELPREPRTTPSGSSTSTSTSMTPTTGRWDTAPASAPTRTSPPGPRAGLCSGAAGGLPAPLRTAAFRLTRQADAHLALGDVVVAVHAAGQAVGFLGRRRGLLPRNCHLRRAEDKTTDGEVPVQEAGERLPVLSNPRPRRSRD